VAPPLLARLVSLKTVHSRCAQTNPRTAAGTFPACLWWESSRQRSEQPFFYELTPTEKVPAPAPAFHAVKAGGPCPGRTGPSAERAPFPPWSWVWLCRRSRPRRASAPGPASRSVNPDRPAPFLQSPTCPPRARSSVAAHRRVRQQEHGHNRSCRPSSVRANAPTGNPWASPSITVAGSDPPAGSALRASA
jgi:hypothetical protein